MNQSLQVAFVFVIALSASGCWVAHRADDRPQLRANIDRSAVLTQPYFLSSDTAGRLHLTIDEVPTGHTLIERLPAGVGLSIVDVVYRISEPGRRDYYVVEVETSSGPRTVEIPIEERSPPAWRYEEKTTQTRGPGSDT